MPEVPSPPPIAGEPLSVVLLASNAAAHLEAVVSDWITYLNGLDRPYEVFLVDDGSTDGSADLCRHLTERHRHLRFLALPSARGEGACLRAALAEAKHPLLFYARCAPRYQPADLRKFLQEIDKVHIVPGYRAGRPVPLFWRLLGTLQRGFCWIVFGHAPAPLPGWLGWRRHLGQWFARAFFAVGTHDTTCPFRLLRRSVFERIPIQSDGAFVHVEILAKANFLGHLLAEEVPLGDRNRPVEAETTQDDRLGRILSDAHRVFHHPDFGPARLVEPVSVPPVATETAPPRLHICQPETIDERSRPASDAGA
jgi:glycosyltransferase involved in cell wall biosynthesis